jgi:hypothetical protein
MLGFSLQRLKLEYDEPLSNFAFNTNLCLSIEVAAVHVNCAISKLMKHKLMCNMGRGLHSSTFQLNVSAFVGTRGV